MAFPVNTGGSVPSLSGTYIPEIWSGKLLEKFYMSTVFAQVANTAYEGDITSHGDKVIIRTVPDITVREYTKGENLTVENPTSANVELLIDKGFYYAFNVYDVDKKQADVNFMDNWATDASEQMKIKIDSKILSTIYDDVDVDNAGTAAGAISNALDLGTTGTPVAITKANVIDKLVEAGQVLDEQNVPETDRWAVIPAWMASRIKTSDLKDASMTGDGKSVLRNGRLGMIDRWTLYASNNLLHAPDGSYEGFHVLMGHKSALTFASQLVKNEITPNPNDFGQIMRGLQVFGFKVIQPKSMLDMYCYAA
jgi:hypothetical protein